MKNKTLKAICVFLALALICVFPAGQALAAVKGDVDGDGRVTAADARLALRASVGLEKYTAGSAKFTAADYNSDGRITAEDARAILRISVGLPADGGANQYDILRSGRFYTTGACIMDGTVSPMEMGVDGSTVYLSMADGDMNVGYLVKGKDVYFLNKNEKIYWKPNALEKAFLKSQGLPDASEISAEIAESGFSSMPPLSSADSVGAGTAEGKSCTVYTFNLSDSSVTRVYMNGSRLLAIENRTAGERIYWRFYSVSATLPTLPPSDYRSVISAVFIASMT
ncbi:MAG: hypothetical protein IK108_04780 [Clostridia bacterium]|nr:hypothetical protein [Clostridia bacterium]